MDEVERVIKSISLPITLPEYAFIAIANRRIPNIDFILQQYLTPLIPYLNTNATAPGGGTESVLIPLIKGGYLKITLRDNELVGLAVSG